jgi:hypothetical protein
MIEEYNYRHYWNLVETNRNSQHYVKYLFNSKLVLALLYLEIYDMAIYSDIMESRVSRIYKNICKVSYSILEIVFQISDKDRLGYRYEDNRKLSYLYYLNMIFWRM